MDMKVKVRERAGADIHDQQPQFGKHSLMGLSEQPTDPGGGGVSFSFYRSHTA